MHPLFAFTSGWHYVKSPWKFRFLLVILYTSRTRPFKGLRASKKNVNFLSFILSWISFPVRSCSGIFEEHVVGDVYCWDIWRRRVYAHRSFPVHERAEDTQEIWFRDSQVLRPVAGHMGENWLLLTKSAPRTLHSSYPVFVGQWSPREDRARKKHKWGNGSCGVSTRSWATCGR